MLVRGGQAAIVDTGVSRSADAIEDSLAAVGGTWSAVSDVILTHKHNDHIGSLADVLERAPEAAAWAGAEDIPSISAPREVTAVGDGTLHLDLRVTLETMTAA